jgi:hypothetical protein
MSSRASVLEFALRYTLVDVASTYEAKFEPRGLTSKAAERTFANLRHDDLVRPVRFIGGRVLYSPTFKAARRFGLDERRFKRNPTFPTICEHYTALRYCVASGNELLTPGEWAERCPQLASTGRLGERRYFIDYARDPPTPSLILPDYAGVASISKLLKRARRAIADRSQHEVWRRCIYYKFFQLVIVTALPSKADRIAWALRNETFPRQVVALEGLAELLLLKGQPDER